MTQSSTKHLVFISILMFVVVFVQAQQINDSSFNTTLDTPAYTTNKPHVLIDAAHFNVFSTETNRIEPLTKLISADGYEVDTARIRFTYSLLAAHHIVIILTAQGGSSESDSTCFSALNDAEIETLYNWIKSGGSLLFGLDHSPFNYAGRKLAERLGVNLAFGNIEDSVHSEAGIDKGPDNRRATLVFSRTNGLLGNHPITNGRNLEERINKVAVWGGQSITSAKGSSILFHLSSTAYNGGNGFSDFYRKPIGSYNAQAIAFTLGKGRIVITADCSMWTAQLVNVNNEWLEFGMARKDLDNRQFALNVMHWLSHLIN